MLKANEEKLNSPEEFALDKERVHGNGGFFIDTAIYRIKDLFRQGFLG